MNKTQILSFLNLDANTNKITKELVWSSFTVGAYVGKQTVLYNTLTGAMIALEDHIDLNGDFRPTQEALTRVLTNLTRTELDDFADGFFRFKGIREHDLVRTIYERYRDSGDVWSITLLPTLDCNLHCSYCYAYRSHDRVFSDNLIDRIETWVDRIPPTLRELRLCWVGGEPTLATDAILRITLRFKRRCTEIGTRLTVALVTNGTNLNTELSLDLLQVGITHVQVTFDADPPEGGEPVSERAPNGNAFANIVANVAALPEKIKVTARINVRRNGYAQSVALLDCLAINGLTQRTIISFAPILPSGAAGDASCQDLCFKQRYFASTQLALTAAAFKRGFSTYLPFGNKQLCGASVRQSIMIEPNGEIKKCWIDSGNATKSLGSFGLNSDVCLNDKSYWLDFDSPAMTECLECSVLPLCFGSCPWHTKRSGSLDDRCHPLKNEMQGFLSLLYESINSRNGHYDIDAGVLEPKRA